MKRFKIYLVLVILFISGSCKEDTFFKLEHPPQFPYQNVTELEKSVIGLYNHVFANAEWNIAWVNSTILKVSMADDVGFADNREWSYFRETDKENVYLFRNMILLYQTINSANFTLDYLEANNWNPYPGISEADKINNLNRIIGELYFMRGFSYFLLATHYCPAYEDGGQNSDRKLPLRKNYLKDVNDATKPYMGTTKEIYDFIVSDFTKAKEYLPGAFSTGMHPSYQAGRATKFAASAMLARTFFQMHDYEKVKNECDFIIDQNGGQFDLSEDPIAAFNKSDLTRGKEVIMFLAYYDDQVIRCSPSHLSVLNHSFQGQQCIWTETHMSAYALKKLGWMNDPLKDSTLNIVARRDKRFQQLFVKHEKYTPPLLRKPGRFYENRKYFNYRTIWANKTERGPKIQFSNWPLIRLAEIYLTRSVCRFKTGDRAGATADLNKVRKRAWDEKLGGLYTEVNSSEITQEMINDERMIELFVEGDRLDYLRGLKADIGPGDREGYSVEPWNSPKFIWKLPNEEIRLNESIN